MSEQGKITGVIGSYPPQRVSEPRPEGHIACASGPTRRRQYTGSFGRSRPGFGLEELGLTKPAIIQRDLVGVERPAIGDDRCVV